MRGAAGTPPEAMSDDNIFREVDEDLRREQMTPLLDKYGVYVLIGAALIIAVVGGYNVYNWWADKRAAENGAAYYQATQLIDEKKNPEALAGPFQTRRRNLGRLPHACRAGNRRASTPRKATRPTPSTLYDNIAQSGADPIVARLCPHPGRGAAPGRCRPRRNRPGASTDLILTTIRGDIPRESC